MELTIYQVDAFAERLFEGNPAAVVPLEHWLPDKKMQQIALENNLSETAFFVPNGINYHIRWFTPAAEVKLCGHATLASAHVLFYHLNYAEKVIQFNSQSGILRVRRDDNLLVMNFPASSIEEVKMPENLAEAFPIQPKKCIKGRDDLMLVFEKEMDIVNLNPNFQKLMETETRGIIVTAKSVKYDFVSRFFAPKVGINEDPVTGSAHTMLIPYWAKVLNKNKLTAKQISARGGILHCDYLGDYVDIGGKAVTYLTGKITV